DDTHPFGGDFYSLAPILANVTASPESARGQPLRTATFLGPRSVHDRNAFAAKQLADVGDGWRASIALLRDDESSVKVQCELLHVARYQAQRVDTSIIHGEEAPGERERERL